jgi:septum formation protein
MDLPPLILASASPRRAQLMRQLELIFDILPAHTQETAPEHLTPREAVLLNAYHKARAVAKVHPDALVLGADTTVCLGKDMFGKPADLAEAHAMLARLQGHTHQVLTGVCLIHLRRHVQEMFTELTDVTFRQLDDLQIRNYLNLIQPLDKAGAYAIQEHGELIVERIDGSYSNVVGLPMERLEGRLQDWAVRS